MITAVDTNVLLDVFGDDPRYREGSLAALRQALREGEIVACDVVWAEVAAVFPDGASAVAAMEAIPVAYSPLTRAAALRAGDAWRAYRSRGGPRDRVVADFLVGAHAALHADRLLTRDRGFGRAAFAGLVVFDPTPASDPSATSGPTPTDRLP